MRRGHPLTLTQATIAGITRNLASLCSRTDAAWAEGVPEKSFYRWMARGRATQAAIDELPEGQDQYLELTADDTLCYDLYLAVEQAQASAKVHAAARVNAGKAGWQGSARALEWSSSDYARREKHEHSGPDGGPLESIQVIVADRNEGRAALGLPPLVIVRKGSEG